MWHFNNCIIKCLQSSLINRENKNTHTYALFNYLCRKKTYKINIKYQLKNVYLLKI